MSKFKIYGPGPRYDYILNPSTYQDYYKRVFTIKDANNLNGPNGPYGFTTCFNLNGNIPITGMFANCNNSGSTGIGDLAALQSVFSFYKIDKVVATFTAVNTEFSDAIEMPSVQCRYNYDIDKLVTTGGGPIQLEDLTDVKVHKFTNESSVFQYTVYPKQQEPAYLSTTLGVASYVSGPVYKNKWVDLDSGRGGDAVPPHGP